MTGPPPPAGAEQRPAPSDSPPWDPRQPWDPGVVATGHTASTRETQRVGGRRTGPSSNAGSAGGAARLLLLIVVVVVVGLPVVRLLLASAFGPTLSASGVVSGVLLVLGLPLGAVGFHGLAGSATRRHEAPATDAWLRPPVAYLVVALVLFVAAGLAA